VDGREHPDRDTFDQTTLGNSSGRWSGDTLIVDNIGFNDARLNSINSSETRIRI